MNKFFMNFNGYYEIEAETAKEAELKFWKWIAGDKPLPSNIYEIEGIKKKRG